MYILDEPSIGLHQRDNRRLLATLKQLRDIGNTVIFVEHDEDAQLAPQAPTVEPIPDDLPGFFGPIVNRERARMAVGLAS